MKNSHTPHIGQTTVTETWNGTRWVERTLYWNGNSYVSTPVPDDYVQSFKPRARKFAWACIGNGLYVRTRKAR